jgi:hypothetical protein
MAGIEPTLAVLRKQSIYLYTTYPKMEGTLQIECISTSFTNLSLHQKVRAQNGEAIRNRIGLYRVETCGTASHTLASKMVDLTGSAPVASCLQDRRSPE